MYIKFGSTDFCLPGGHTQRNAVGNTCIALTSIEKASVGEQVDGIISSHSGVTWREVRRDPKKAFEKLPIFRVSYMKKNSQTKE